MCPRPPRAPFGGSRSDLRSTRRCGAPCFARIERRCARQPRRKRGPRRRTATSELDLLAGCSHITGSADPPVCGVLERTAVLVAEERLGQTAPVAPDDVRVPEIGIRQEDSRGLLFLVADEVLAAKDFARRRSNELSGHGCILQ